MKWTVLCCLLIFAGTAAVARGQERRFVRINDFMKLDGRMRVIAHRGFSGSAPENTLSAFRKAIEIGADMFELDVLLSRDGKVVVIHDETLDRTTSGTGKVADYSLAELAELDAGTWFSSDFRGESIPTLAEVLELAKEKILVNVEIKTEAVTNKARGGIVEKVLNLVRGSGMEDQVVISSFDPRALAQSRELDPSFHTASLFNRQLQKGMSPREVMDEVGSRGFSLSHEIINASIVEECHRLGRPVAVYTVNEVEKMKELIELGVDALFTDHPDRLLQLVGK
jgi:glycerophosphoryl diester phosphodiesterase